ncbi:MAG: HlyD family efflux transporter periplasmic adaptor subunit [Rhizobiaceae bacterium]
MTANNIENPSLPMEVIDHENSSSAFQQQGAKWSRLFWLPFLMLFLFSGAVIGMYFQPPALQKFFQVTGLQPGAGSKTPIALPPEISLPDEVVATLIPTDVVGLARLLPKGDVSTVAPPFGSGDARVSKILVKVGDTIAQNDSVAVLDNMSQFESIILTARANVNVREANLVQTRQSILTSRKEADAALDQSKAAAKVAKLEFTRKRSLYKRKVVTKAVLDAAQSTSQQADLAVKRATATLNRFSSIDPDKQPDVVVALRNLEAAKIELQRTQRDLEKAFVRTPIAGTILVIHAQPGEKPTAKGLMEIGNINQMMAEVDVYQNVIGQVVEGQPVEIIATALKKTLTGKVSEIGLQVGRQTIISDDTAANTDARVVKVLVELSEESSLIASRYTNLEVVARIDTRTTK